MKERPILFSGPMVRAILDGSKTQTRRVVKPQPTLPFAWHGCWDGTQFWTDNAHQGEKGDTEYRTVPYGTVGDRLWVRETWAHHPDETGIIWRATDPGWDDNDYGIKWRPSIFMPRWASRLTLKVTGVRVERVQDITSEEAMHEGITAPLLNDKYSTMRGGFAILWDEINAKRGYGWDANPWVWVVEFKKV